MSPMPFLALTLSAVVLSACSAGAEDSSEPTASSSRAYHDHSSHDHGKDHVGGQEHSDHAAPGDVSTAVLQDSLIRPDDLPVGYISGAHHQSHVQKPAFVGAGCAPLSAVLHEHRSHHPEVRVTFIKSHFGPQITQSVVDHGTVAAATAALADLSAVPDDCSRYVHSSSAIGANTYRVLRGVDVISKPGVSVRLVARGDDFAAIHWDVWSTKIGSRVLTVAFRSAPGGDNTDFAPAIRAALEQQRKLPGSSNRS